MSDQTTRPEHPRPFKAECAPPVVGRGRNECHEESELLAVETPNEDRGVIGRAPCANEHVRDVAPG